MKISNASSGITITSSTSDASAEMTWSVHILALDAAKEDILSIGFGDKMFDTPEYLKVMADYCSTGLWDEDGINVEVENFKLSPLTIRTLKDWCNLYEENDDYLDPLDRRFPPFDLKSFSEQGLIVAKMIKRDLPDYMIIYFDDYALSREGRGNQPESDTEARLKYEYEVN
jgi:hypothetical protein